MHSNSPIIPCSINIVEMPETRARITIPFNSVCSHLSNCTARLHSRNPKKTMLHTQQFHILARMISFAYASTTPSPANE